MQKLVLPAFLFLSLNTLAQQKPQYSQYMMNNYILNPAISGIEDYTDLKTSYRNQWTDFPGAPVTYYLSGHWAMGKPDRTSSGPRPYISKTIRRTSDPSPVFKGSPRVPGHHGVGFQFISDKIGQSTMNSLGLTYAYHIPLTAAVKLSLGALVGISQYTFSFDNLTVKDNPDPAIYNGKLRAIQPQLNLGAWLYSRNFFLGLSGNNMIFENFNYSVSDSNTPNPYVWLGSTYTQYYVTTGFRQELGEFWSVVPSVLLKRVRQAPLSYDVNIKAMYNNRFWFGASYRRNDAVVGLVGVNINSNLNLSYSYDYTLSGLNDRSKGSHEIVIGLMLHNKQKLLCPQNLW
ncbi:type IX secretion system membrane protein, PorP/SprF family [Pseudarcicella hirudinis]|uniref:Type IX secretion system membrane protein, PorP/SprF family n=2 Tax=Pseudarcicella hirudinis TaxID=1079859 RepID=A0A1I5WMZ3_9BACT|nr:type IX secretion system membrane protein PorP/SprF [Pseudarcicella hirudinis]SFQ21173.1 type IX secretion system membrane protein, PorP/SprF family [Pseudarcicella hirudinis]